MTPKSILVVFLALLIGSPLPSFAITQQQIDPLAQAFMKKYQVAGLSIAVIDKDKTQIYNYGYADPSKKIPTSTNTLYPIASFTKTITATLAAIAAREGKLNLDRPFIQYFPGLDANANLSTITTRQLLGHVSSLPFDFQPRPQTYPALVKSLIQFTPSRAPGSEYAYSNAGIGTVGYVLQNIYGQSYNQLLEEKILKPLNMQSTYLNVPKSKEKYLTQGHEKDDSLAPYNPQVGAWFAAGSLKSTIGDMAKYLNAHIHYASLQNKTLSQAIEIVHENTYCFADNKSCEQLAWQAHEISELKNSNGDALFVDFNKEGIPLFNTLKIAENKDFEKNRLFIDKTCSGFGMSGYMAYIPDQEQGVVILANKFLGDERIRLGRDILMSGT